MNILITGSSGFLGSALATRLALANHRVSLLIRKNTNLYRIKDLSSFIVGRCKTDEEINQFIVKVDPDVVIHTACCYGRDNESLIQVYDSNFRFGAVILNALKNFGKRVCFVNAGTTLPKDVNWYSFSKFQFEELAACTTNFSNQAIQFINLKLQHMYGPGDDPSKFTSYVINSCKNHLPKLSLTHGEQKRDFIYIDDVVDAYEVILRNIAKFDNHVQIEIGSGETYRLKYFVEMVHELTNSKTVLLFGHTPHRKNEAESMVADISILKQLGWFPRFDLKAGIKKTIELDVVE